MTVMTTVGLGDVTANRYHFYCGEGERREERERGGERRGGRERRGRGDGRDGRGKVGEVGKVGKVGRSGRLESWGVLEGGKVGEVDNLRDSQPHRHTLTLTLDIDGGHN
jgi:hypothetical protein